MHDRLAYQPLLLRAGEPTEELMVCAAAVLEQIMRKQCKRFGEKSRNPRL